MSKKCEICNKWLKNNRGYNIHFQRMHGKKQMFNVSQLEFILNRIQKLELDNNFLKHQIKHKSFVNSSKDSGLNWDIPKEIKEAKNETKISMNFVVKEIMIIFKSQEPFLKRDFRFSDEELGIKEIEITQKEKVNPYDLLKPINPIEVPIIPPIMVEVLV